MTDRLKTFKDACESILNADAQLQTLLGRTVRLVVPWRSLRPDDRKPVIAYTLVSDVARWEKTNTTVVQFAAFAPTRATTDECVARVAALLTWTAFNARGIDAAPDPAQPPSRSEPDEDADLGDEVEAQSVIVITFITPAT